jgi:hypothetical protein
MKYTVVWRKAAENKLALLYEAAADKRAITNASNRIDRELKHDPGRKTVSWEEYFLYESEPLLVVLTISPDDRLVAVVDVQLMS